MDFIKFIDQEIPQELEGAVEYDKEEGSPVCKLASEGFSNKACIEIGYSPKRYEQYKKLLESAIEKPTSKTMPTVVACPYSLRGNCLLLDKECPVKEKVEVITAIESLEG